MTDLFLSFGFHQEAARDFRREGLPFWIFWFLLCIILLLVLFIFLRDKDLRRKLSAFLSSARRKVLRSRFQARTKKAKTKVLALRTELGRTAWSGDIGSEFAESAWRELKELDEAIRQQQLSWQEAVTSIENLHRRKEDIREHFRSALQEEESARKPFLDELGVVLSRIKEMMESATESAEDLEATKADIKGLEKELKQVNGNEKITNMEKEARVRSAGEVSAALYDRAAELQEKILSLESEHDQLKAKQKDLQARIDAFNGRIRALADEYKEKIRRLEKQTREEEKRRGKIQAGITERQRRMEPLFCRLGEALESSRPANAALDPFYANIDAIQSVIHDLESRIEKLR